MIKSSVMLPRTRLGLHREIAEQFAPRDRRHGLPGQHTAGRRHVARCDLNARGEAVQIDIFVTTIQANRRGAKGELSDRV